MASALADPSSPASREAFPHIDMETHPSPHVNQTLGPFTDVDMGRDKDKPRLEILLDTPFIFLKGVGADVEPARLSGHLALYLTESTPIKEITLQFRGKARLPQPSSDSSPSTYIVCQHDWSFLEGEKHTAHTLKAGRHLVPFQLQIGGTLPATISCSAFGGASVAYKLSAHAMRTGFYHQNLQATLPVPVIRSFAAEALEYQQTLEIENTWPEKLMYSIMLPHKAWPAGDKVTALVKFSPLSKGVCILNVKTAIHEQTKIFGRYGAQESTRIMTSVKHEIIGNKAVQVETTRSGSQSTSSHAPPPTGTPRTSSHPQPAHRTSSSSSGIHLNMQFFSRTHSPPPSSETQSDHNPPSEEVPTTDSPDPENSDVVTYLSIPVPSSMTPSHSLEPITVSHRIRWSILILNLDGHTSELRCSLPIHILDYRLLSEARAFSAATRRLLLGGSEVPPAEEEEDAQLPSYKSHVRDRVANMFLPESATMRVTNPWVSHGTSPTYSPSGPAPPATHPPAPRPGHATPLEAHLLSHLPHAPGSGASTPLDWVNSELLLSLSEDAPPPPAPAPSPTPGHTPLTPPSPATPAHTDPEPPSRLPSPHASRRASRFPSRAHSRAASPERHAAAPAHAPDAAARARETYVHSGHASRALPGLFRTAMRPAPSFSPVHWMSRPTAHHHAAPGAQAQAADALHRGPHTVAVPLHDALAGPALLHRAFTEVPGYAVASRGFIGGVPPLESMRGLPSYEETLRAQGGSDVVAS